MKASEIDSGTHTSEKLTEQDKSNPYGSQRPRLTLRKIHQLRLMHELKKLEAAQKRKFVSDMYGSAYEESDDKTIDSKNPPKLVKPPKPSKPSKPSKYLDKYTRS